MKIEFRKFIRLSKKYPWNLSSDKKEEEGSYLKHARKLLKDSVEKTTDSKLIRNFYKDHKKSLTDKIFKKHPLRYFTHDLQIGRAISIPNPDYERVLINIVDSYIHKYRVELDKDVTLEEAIQKIIT